MANDLEPAALRLRPEVAADARCAPGCRGRWQQIVSGSGPTAFGLFPHRAAAEEAASGITGAFAASPV